MRRISIGFASAIVALWSVFSGSATAIELDGSWSSTYRENIKVRICFGSFATWIPELNQTKLVTAVNNMMDLWGVYGQVKVKFVYDGAADDSSSYCQVNGQAPTGYLYVRAERAHPGSFYGSANCSTWCGDRSRCWVVLYGQDWAGSDYGWSYDHPDGALTVQSIGLHEFGHTLGFYDYSTEPNQHNSVMRYVDATQRWPWHEDIRQLRATSWSFPDQGIQNCWPSTPYPMRQDRYIRHKRSTDGGTTWVPESDGTNEATNLPVGIAFGVTSDPDKPYVLAWVGTNGSNNINTKLTRGDISSSKVVHDDRSEMGVTVAYGNSKWLLAYAGVDEDYAFRGRKIFYKTSTNGSSWSGTYQLGNCNSLPEPRYGSLSAPVAAFDSASGRFILLFVNWRTDPVHDETVPYGKIRWYTSTDPSAGFNNCGELSQLSWNTPGLACNTSGSCVVTATDYRTNGDNQFWNSCGWVSGGNFTVGPWTAQTDWTTRSEVANAFGSNRYLVAYRGQNGLTSGNIGQKTACSGSTPWGSKVILGSDTFYFGPTLVYGPTWNEFAVYYTAP
ncbi:MAG TPA: hypothetical protein PLQ97_05995 [Myxococcota bacterium]|nr:hypothetical protein [Myxococcota bacterium]HQK50214.1 hypothetical protein [Myxococcota bacterium]